MRHKVISPARARAAAITCGVNLSMKSPVTRTVLTLLAWREFSTALLACVLTRATRAFSSSACISNLLCCCILSPSSALLTASAAPARRSTGADASAVRSSTRAVSRWTYSLEKIRFSPFSSWSFTSEQPSVSNKPFCIVDKGLELQPWSQGLEISFFFRILPLPTLVQCWQNTLI